MIRVDADSKQKFPRQQTKDRVDPKKRSESTTLYSSASSFVSFHNNKTKLKKIIFI